VQKRTLDIAGTLTVLPDSDLCVRPRILFGPRHIYLPSCSLATSSLSLLLIHNIFSSIHQTQLTFSPFGSFCFWSSNSCHSFRLTLCFSLLAFGFFAFTLFSTSVSSVVLNYHTLSTSTHTLSNCHHVVQDIFRALPHSCWYSAGFGSSCSCLLAEYHRYCWV